MVPVSESGWAPEAVNKRRLELLFEESASRPRRRTILAPNRRREGGKRRPRVSWPQALRAVRRWLEPYVMLRRYWGTFSGMPPPPELKALLERVFSGRGLYLYVHYQQTNDHWL